MLHEAGAQCKAAAEVGVGGTHMVVFPDGITEGTTTDKGYAMIGVVSGLPTKVASRAAMILPRISQPSSAADRK